MSGRPCLPVLETGLSRAGVGLARVALVLGMSVANSALGSAQQVAADVMTTATAEVPVVTPGSFYAAGMVVPDSAIVPVGRLVEVVAPSVVTRRVPPQIQPYDRVNMVVAGRVLPGDRLQLLRAGRQVVPYGRMFVVTGSARVLAVESGVATIEVVQLFDRVAPGDLAVQMPDFPVRSGVRAVPHSGLEGQILTSADPQPVVSYGEVYVNLGAASGVTEGDEFTAYIPSSVEDWGIRPEIEVGRLQIVRVTTLTSAARIVSLEHPAVTSGLPIRLVAKMP